MPLITFGVVLGLCGLFGLSMALQIALIRELNATLRGLHDGEVLLGLRSAFKAHLLEISEELAKVSSLLQRVNQALPPRGERVLSSGEFREEAAAERSSSLEMLNTQLETLRADISEFQRETALSLMSEFQKANAEHSSSLGMLRGQMEKLQVDIEMWRVSQAKRQDAEKDTEAPGAPCSHPVSGANLGTTVR